MGKIESISGLASAGMGELSTMNSGAESFARLPMAREQSLKALSAPATMARSTAMTQSSSLLKFRGPALVTTTSTIGRWGGTALSTGSASVQRWAGAAFSTGKAMLSTTAGAVTKLLPFVGVAQGAVGVVQSVGRRDPLSGATSGMAVGSAIGSVVPGWGTAIGAAVGAAGGALLASIKSGKSDDQRQRDSVRAGLVQAGVLAHDFTVPLADGSRYDIGKDGGKRAEFGGFRPYEVNFERQYADYAVAWANEIAATFSNGNTKIQSDFAGYFANAAMSNASSLLEVRKNIDTIRESFSSANSRHFRTVQ